MRSSDGFTFLEMLVTVAITALLVAAAVQAYIGISRAQERETGELSTDRYVEIFLDRFERELSGALLIVKPSEGDRLAHPYLFLGEDRFDAEHEVDMLRFVTQTPARAARAHGAGGVSLVTYAVVTAEDLDGLDLARREEPLPPALSKEIDMLEAQTVFEDVAQFQLLFLDELDGEWRDAWDSTDISLLDRLPLEVEANVALYVPDAEGNFAAGPVHTRRIALPVRELDLEAMRQAAYGGDGEGPGGCVTVAQCVSLFQKTLDAEGPEYAAAARSAVASAGDLCWDETRVIAGMLRGLNADTETECAAP